MSLIKQSKANILLFLVIFISLLKVSRSSCSTTALPNCLICATNSSCSSCVSGYFVSPVSTCQPCSSQISNCSSCTYSGTLICSFCNAPLGLLNNVCISCSQIPNCLSCSVSTNIFCNTCSSNLIVSFNKTACISCGISNCLSCSTINSTSSNCSQCLPGFYLNSSSSCLSCANSISFCSSCSLDQNAKLLCLSCVDNRLFVSNNLCLANCLTFSITGCSQCRMTNLALSTVICISCS